MRTKYETYNDWVSLFITSCETILAGGLFYVLFMLIKNTAWQQILNVPHYQVLLTVMLCYFISSMQVGVVLYKRKVYAYQIISKISKTIFLFGIIAGIVLEAGEFMDSWSYFYLFYLITLFLCIIIFRIFLRKMLKQYRSKGGNLRFVVLVGSGENNLELYHEMTD